LTVNPCRGADASSVVTPDEMQYFGLQFVVRYFSQFPNKNLQISEAQNLSRAGFNLVCVYEDDVNDWAGGFARGVEDAKRYLSQAANIGVPTDRPCYFAVDENMDPNDPRLADYFRGAGSVLGVARVGVYGSTAVCRALKSLNLVKWTWRSMSTAWRGGEGSSYEFNIEQTGYINQKLDLDAAITDDYGQWRIGWSPIQNVATVKLSVVDMCAHEDRSRPANVTTDFAQVYPVQKALAAEGFLSPQFCNGHYGLETISAYAGWQGKCGYRGKDADGIPGLSTLSRLGALHNFHVVS
jgi:hypothetical protein